MAYRAQIREVCILCKSVQDVPLRHANRQELHTRKQRHQGCEFRTSRRDLGLSVEDAAKLLHVSLRTFHNWEAGAARVPYAAFKLIRGERLITPEGREFQWADQNFHSLERQVHEAAGPILPAAR